MISLESTFDILCLLNKVQQIATFPPFILGFITVGPWKGGSEELEKKWSMRFLLFFSFSLK